MVVIEVLFDSTVYKLDVIKKAAYRFTDKFAINFRLDSSQVICELNFIDKKSKEFIDQAVNDFKSEVLDQDLREKISN